MSLISICQDVADDLALSVPATIVGNIDETATRLLAAAKKAGRSLARKPQGGWIASIREFDFVTVAGQADYSLPDDFQRLIDSTVWDRSRFWQMRGPLSPQQWQMYKSSVIGQASIQRRYRFRSIPVPSGGAFSAGFSDGFDVGSQRGKYQQVFSIDPMPTEAGTALVFEYVSSAWCAAQDGTPQPTWQADTDIGILDEDLISLGVTWRMLRRLGLSYNEELSEYESEVAKAMAHDGGAAILSIVPQNYEFLLGPGNVQEGSFPGR